MDELEPSADSATPNEPGGTCPQFAVYEKWQASGEPIMTIVESTPSGICITDEDGVFEYVNQAYCTLYGYQLQELIGKPFTVVVPESHRAWLIELHQKFISGTNEVRGEWPVRAKNGDELFILADAVRIVGMDGRPKKVTFVVDITARKRAEDELARSEALLREAVATKDKFFSIIAHDLKNSFQVLTGGAELLILTNSRHSPEQTLSRAKMMHQASLSSLKLLNNLLTWAQSQTGTLKCLPQKLKLTDALGLAMQPLSEKARAKSIPVTFQVAQDATVLADPDMLNTVLFNLIGNALKFSPKGNPVTISAREEAGWQTLEVRDAGVGMDQDTLERLFRIDCKGSRKGTEGELGTGLGLILCKEFVEINGGRIWAASALGAGSVFSFTLPTAGSADGIA